MGKVTKILTGLILVVALPLCAYLVALVWSSYSKGYSWSEMDWDNDGHTSWEEFFQAGDTGARSITADGKQCREIYRYKDGLPLKTICP